MDLYGIHFANPQWLLGLLALPFLAAVLFFLSRAKYTTLALGNPKMVEAASGIFSAQLIPPLLRFVVLALCLIAAARPQAGQKKVEEKRPVTDLFVALDVSYSMIQNDLKPNRITAAKKILADFLGKVQNVRLGMTIFAGVSFTQCPLTTDMEIVKRLLANVELASIRVGGTAIGDAILSSLNRLKNGTGKPKGGEADKNSLISRLVKTDEAEEPGGKNYQAIILMTDGSNNAGHIDPLAAAKLAVSQGVKIYTIGMGTQERVPAMGQYQDGHVGPYVDPRTGGLALTEPADMLLLNEIAKMTGGKSYQATDNQALQNVLTEIARLEKRDVSVTTHMEYQELAYLFLIAAFIILAFDMALEMTILRTLP